ncbi:HNH endonuclease signature motif containing protein [Gordonia alkaliphila]|uniref:HNH endonuclease signature motif containing protein n=1 Tax=Gordonia alkaliphila TaxID=1053547 RepID=A0ABP8ZCW9_9ACTN
MDAAALTAFADSISDDLTIPVGADIDAPANLGQFLARARAVDDDREVLAVTAAVLRLRNVADYSVAATCAAIERVGLPARKHVRSGAAILAELGAAPAVAYRAGRLGQAIADENLVSVTRGLRDGAVSAEHGDAVVSGLGHVAGRVELSDEDRRKIVHSLLVQTSPARVREKARAWAIKLAPEAPVDGEVPVAERDDLNEMTLNRTDDGRVAVTIDFDIVAAEELSGALDPLTRPVPEPDGSQDRRSAKRRRADAMAQVIRTYLSHSERPESGGVLPHVTLSVPAAVVMNGQVLDSVAGQAISIPVAVAEDDTAVPWLGFGGPISARTAELIMCEASVALALLDEHGVPLNVGREKRLFPPSIRKALVLRDRGCAFPGCGVPPSWCDGHHVEHWEHGGVTSLDNGVLLCRRHHTVVHHGGWEVFIGRDRQPWFIPPADPDHPKRRREPIRSNARRTLTLSASAA